MKAHNPVVKTVYNIPLSVQVETIRPADTQRNDPPPSYDSLFGRLKRAHENSKSIIDFARSAMDAIFDSAFFIIFIGIVLAIPITEIVMGASYLDDCPAQRLIPIYLIVAGVFGTLKGIELIGQSIKSNKDQTNGAASKRNDRINPFDFLLNLFLIVWFICGNVWVYGLKDAWVSSPVTAGNYCHPTIYYFSFWIITSAYIMMGVGCLFGCFTFLWINKWC